MIGSLMMCVSTVLLLGGTVGGVVMGIQHNFTLAPAHAHLNLIGGVLMFLFGLYYRQIPAAAASRLGRLQGSLHIAGALLFPAGLALTLLYGDAFIPAAILGALIVLSAFALFCVVVTRTAWQDRTAVAGRSAGRPRPQLQPYPWHSQGNDSRRSGAPTT
jgi:hypothetical protein